MMVHDEALTDQQISDWYGLIHRVLDINKRPAPGNKAYAPEPLRADIQECVDRGLLSAERLDQNRPQDRFLLTVPPKGQAFFHVVHDSLVESGQAAPIDAQVDERPAETANPFDGMD